MTHNIGQFGKDLEEQIRKELGTVSPVSWCEDVKNPNQTTDSLRSEIHAILWGDELGLRGQLIYILPASFRAQLRVGVIQPGMNSCVATLHYSADLETSFRGKITFVKDNSGMGAFYGDTPLCDKIKGNKEILTLASALYRGEYTLGNLFIQILPQLVLEGNGNVLHLDVLTVPFIKKGLLGGKILYNIKKFLQLTSLIKSFL